MKYFTLWMQDHPEGVTLFLAEETANFDNATRLCRVKAETADNLPEAISQLQENFRSGYQRIRLMYLEGAGSADCPKHP